MISKKIEIIFSNLLDLFNPRKLKFVKQNNIYQIQLKKIPGKGSKNSPM